MNDEGSSKKIWIIALVVLMLIALGVGIFFFMSHNKTSKGGTKGVGSLFGLLGEDTPRQTGGTINTGSSTSDGTGVEGTNVSDEPMFRQLSTIQVAGATTVVHDGKTFVRYIARENGFVYEVDPVTGVSRQLTNTSVLRIYEAYWGNNGNTVVIRFLYKDPYSQKDTIQTEIGDLVLPIGSSTELGTLEGLRDRLRDDISAVSVSPNGAYLFFLLPVEDGVSGTIVTLATRSAKEVLRNAFREWSPQMLDDGNVILSTKPSWNVPGFSYLLSSKNHSLSRLIREKNGLTTLTNSRGKRMLYSENISGNTAFGMYDAVGFANEDGQSSHLAPLQISTLPEKCIWAKNNIRIFCAAFAATGQSHIPDDWYQGALSLQDTFWTINTDSDELVYLADPQKILGHSFDVMSPFAGGDEKHFFFINKNDFTLWSMRLKAETFNSEKEDTAVEAPVVPELTPTELKDAAGSIASSSRPKSTGAHPKKTN